MTNFEKYISELTPEQFADSMILNCDGCPAYPCEIDGDIGTECVEELINWCNQEVDE